MNQAYINSYLHISPSTYGKKLSPLTVGHSLILDFISSPFFTGKPITEQDLKTAVFFCSIDFQTGIKYLTDRNQLQKEILNWSKEITKSKVVYDFQNEMETFKTYFEYYLKFPRRWEDKANNHESKVPWQYSVIWLLLERYEEMEVMNMPLTKAMCFVACQNNINGDSNLAGVDQSELLDDWEKEEKELNHE